MGWGEIQKPRAPVKEVLLTCEAEKRLPELIDLGDHLARMMWGVRYRGDCGAGEEEITDVLTRWKAAAHGGDES